jgi:hypothetical protein
MHTSGSLTSRKQCWNKKSATGAPAGFALRASCWQLPASPAFPSISATEKEGAMNSVVFQHVPVAELPEKWRARLTQAGGATVTVRIEEEPRAEHDEAEDFANDPLFGMWRDRGDMADVAGYVRRVRVPRFENDGTQRDG